SSDLSLENVRQGIFDVTNKLWGLTYKELNNVPKYHEDVTVWEVFDKDNSSLGLLYMDMHPRASKRGGAWMTSFRSQQMEDGKRKAPVIRSEERRVGKECRSQGTAIE